MLFRTLFMTNAFILAVAGLFGTGCGVNLSRGMDSASLEQQARKELTDEKMAEIESELAERMVDNMSAEAKASKDSYYKVNPLFSPVPKPGKNWVVQNFGPVGIGITLTKPGFTMKIRNVEKDSPAAATGKLKKGQIIESINGKVLKDIDPRIILGNIITEAEATDGVIKLKIKDEGVVTVKIPVLGAYSESWPLDCPKSDKIVRNLADLLAKQEKPRWGSVLFLLSTGEEKDLEVVRKWMAQKDKIGSYPWHAGYLGLGVCEYYLRTGDKSVLPMIKGMAERLRDTMYNGGWSGRGTGASFTYSTGTGQMHAAGVHCVTFLLLAKMCGVDVDEYTLQKSLKTFYRFAGHENVPYGDGLPEGGFRDNGKTAGLAVAMSAAAQLTPNGETSIYARARDISATKSFYATNWFHSAHTGGGIGEIWHNAAISMMYERRPVKHRSFLLTRRWVMDLSRRFDGSIGIAGVHDRYDKSASEHSRSWGTYFALTYTIPRQNLQMFGAPKTKWCKTYELPERPWGRPADDAFVSVRPAKHESITMKDVLQETVRDDASKGCFSKIGPDDVSDETLLYYLHHPECGLRIATMRTVVRKGRDHLIMPLFTSEDPRMRHMGILAVKGMFKGRPLPDNRLKPEMFEHIGKMIEDPDESLWVVQDAMYALERAKPEVIAKHRDRLLEFVGHDDWFLRRAAMKALAPISAHKAHYKKILPPVFQTLAASTTAQALNPVWSLSKYLKRADQEVQAFALEHLKKAYQSVPDKMVAPSGHVTPNGPETVRQRIATMIKSVPGGNDALSKMKK